MNVSKNIDESEWKLSKNMNCVLNDGLKEKITHWSQNTKRKILNAQQTREQYQIIGKNN